MTVFRQEKDRSPADTGTPVKTKKHISGESLGTHDSSADDAQNPQQDVVADVFAQQLTGIYVAVAEIKSPGPDKRFRRYYFANLPSAQRRVDLARQDGREAYLYLGQIHIVDGDHLD